MKIEHVNFSNSTLVPVTRLTMLLHLVYRVKDSRLIRDL